MLRIFRHRFALVQAIVLSVVFAGAGITAEVAQLERSAAVAQRAVDQRRAETAAVARYQAEAYQAAVQARDQAQAKAGELQQALDAANADRDAKQQEIDRLKALTAYSPGYGGSGGAAPATANRFPWGYCTWYVASRRAVPWMGNARDWFWAAAGFGYAEGRAPRPGAIMVTAESWFGHVAYVESVAGDGSWTVSEMNYRGFGIVSGRTIRPGGVPLIGFIY